MDALELIKTRRSTRSFKEEKVENDLLNSIIEAGRYAPSGGNNQASHLIVIENKDYLDQLANLVCLQFQKMKITDDMYKSMKNSILRSKKGGYVFHYHAPTLIVVCNQKGYSNAFVDSACILENMMIMANALDLGSCWINQLTWLSDHQEIRDYLKLDENEMICGALALGYPNTQNGLPNRIPLERTGNKVDFIKK